eukprot:CAMPEP_0114494992 /NCGR_PEP_ID=MMETSP0109-20121206/4959_1 /TAXON_ID=29199 /ORGANISM="Chlorarachnion reptans, Strain CCCM449" /LENGTH=439 /DNA_ID=CAMNT_0001672089 /DNA_START=143 /DNA_END=1462 /DNA_ORIENTATION=-
MCEWCRLQPEARGFSGQVAYPFASPDPKDTMVFSMKGYPELKKVLWKDAELPQRAESPHGPTEGTVSGYCGDMVKEVNLLGLSVHVEPQKRETCFDYASVIPRHHQINVEIESGGAEMEVEPLCTSSDLPGGWIPKTGVDFDPRWDELIQFGKNEIPVFLPVLEISILEGAERQYHRRLQGCRWKAHGCRHIQPTEEAINSCLLSGNSGESSKRNIYIIGNGGIVASSFLRWIPQMRPRYVELPEQEIDGIVASIERWREKAESLNKTSLEAIVLLSMTTFLSWGKMRSPRALASSLAHLFIQVSNALRQIKSHVFIILTPSIYEFTWPYQTGTRAEAYNAVVRHVVGLSQNVPREPSETAPLLLPEEESKILELSANSNFRLELVGLDHITKGRLDFRSPHALRYANESSGEIFAAVAVIFHSICHRTGAIPVSPILH